MSNGKRAPASMQPASMQRWAQDKEMADEVQRLVAKLRPYGINYRVLGTLCGFSSGTVIQGMVSGRERVRPEILAYLRVMWAFHTANPPPPPLRLNARARRLAASDQHDPPPDQRAAPEYPCHFSHPDSHEDQES